MTISGQRKCIVPHFNNWFRPVNSYIIHPYPRIRIIIIIIIVVFKFFSTKTCTKHLNIDYALCYFCYCYLFQLSNILTYIYIYIYNTSVGAPVVLLVYTTSRVHILQTDFSLEKYSKYWCTCITDTLLCYQILRHAKRARTVQPRALKDKGNLTTWISPRWYLHSCLFFITI